MGVRISIAIICYNQAAYIEDAVRAAMRQEYDDLEIIVSDDCSSDDTFNIAQAVAKDEDPNRTVRFNRNETNLGLAGNVNRVFELAESEIVMLAAGDDISLPTRATKTAELFADPRTMAVSFGLHRFCDSKDALTHSDEAIGKVRRHDLEDYQANPLFHINGASRAYRRSVFEQFGPLSNDCPTEDSTLLLRACILGHAVMCQSVELNYRVHGGNLYASANRYSTNFGKILKQYESDLATAEASRWISATQSKTMQRLLNQRTTFRTLQAELQQSKFRVGFAMGKVIPNRVLSLRKKLKLLKSVFSRRRGN